MFKLYQSMINLVWTTFNSLAENTPNASKNFGPICLPKPKSFEFLKKSSVWVSAVRETSHCYLLKYILLSYKMRIYLHTLWEGNKILRNLHLTFVLCSARWRFRKILWPSQNIWTLISKVGTFLEGTFILSHLYY